MGNITHTAKAADEAPPSSSFILNLIGIFYNENKTGPTLSRDRILSLDFSLSTGRQLKVIVISRNQTQDPHYPKDEPSLRLTMVL